MKKILSIGLAGVMTAAALAAATATAEAGGPYKGPKPYMHMYKHKGNHGFNGGAFIAGTVLGMAALGAYGAYANPYPYPYPQPVYRSYGGGNWNAHVQWCFQNYPNSYNPRANTYVAWNGRTYYCDSPFM